MRPRRIAQDQRLPVLGEGPASLPATAPCQFNRRCGSNRLIVILTGALGQVDEGHAAVTLTLALNGNAIGTFVFAARSRFATCTTTGGNAF